MRPAGDKNEACESAAKRGPSVTVSRLPALAEGRPWGPAALSEPPALPPASVKPWAAHCPLGGGLHYLQTPAVLLFCTDCLYTQAELGGEAELHLEL